MNFGRIQIGLAWICAHDHLSKVSWHGMLRCQAGRPGRFWLIFGALVPATTAHPKLVALVRNKQNMHGTWCKAPVIPVKLMAKMGNNGRQPVAGR